MNFKNLSKKITAFALSAFTVLTLAGGVLQSVSANGGSGSGGSGGGQVTGDNPGYTVWFDQWGADGEPAQGWGEASMNNMQARIEGMLGKTMNPNAYGGTRPYLEIYQQAAREALADAQTRSATGRARIVGVTSIYWDGGDNMQAAYDSKANVMRLAGTRPGTVDELPDNTGWSTTYNNGDGANGTNWRDWLEQYGVAKAADTNLTMIVWAVAEGEPTIPNIDLSVKKVSTLPDVVKGNECYAQDLSGAEYEVHRKADLSDTPLYTLVTDATGNVKAPEQIPFDSANPYLYVKETKAPKGYKLDPEVHVVSPYKKDSWLVTSYEEPMNDPVAIKLTKISEDLVENPASLEGAEFTVKFYAGQYTKETLPASATRTWVIKTVKNASGKYITGLRDEWKVSGDDFYLTQAGFPTLPLGTVTVEETKAPKGYTLKNKTLNTTDGTEISDGVALFNISENFEHIPGVVGGNEYTISEGVKRSGFEIKKIDEETNEPIGVAEFKILNTNDFDVKYIHKDGTSEIIKAGEESAETIVTDSLGQYTSAVDALQSGKYKLVEVKAPEGYLINQYTDFEISDETEINTIGATITVNEVKMHTKAVEKETQKNVLDGSKTEQTIVDTVKYKHLVVGKEYTVTGELAIKPIGKTVEELIATPSELFERVKNDNGDVITSSVTFTPTTPDGEVQVEFKINPSKYAGQKIVAFEKMEQGGLLVGHHANILDTEQTVTVSMDLEVSIVKADKDNTNKVLKGAEITVFNADGTVAKDKNGKDAVGITDENGKVTFKLAYDQDNEMYVMETKAPEGYTLSTEKYPVKRTGNDKLGVDQISITVLDDKVPPTGIQSNMLVYAGVLIVAGIALSVVLLKKNKNK